MLDRLGRGLEARTAIAATLGHAATLMLLGVEQETSSDSDDVVSRRDLGRALTTAGLFALHDGDLLDAERSLRLALALHATAAAAHALGAALYHQGDVAAAASYKAQLVELEPTSMRYRWALVVSLMRIGRTEEARAHADTAPIVPSSTGAGP